MILSLETSTHVCSVSLHNSENGNLITHIELHVEKSHSNSLSLLIEQVLHLAKAQKKDLSAIAISKGPGSYTGLRIGTAIAKGLCFALDIPLIAVDTLKSMALEVYSQQGTQKDFYLCPMLDARRMEVYTVLYDNTFKKTIPVSAQIIDESSFEDSLTQTQIYFFGNGADKCKEVIKHPNASFLNDIYPSSKYIGFLAFERYSTQKFEDIAYFEPFYLKDFMVKPAKNKLL